MVVLCGLQASGKSSFARQRLAGTHAYVSKDLMRNARRKEARQAALVTEHLAAGDSVVVDNTNPTVEDRRRLIALGREHGARVIGYWFPTTAREALRRNAERSGRERVPDVAIHATAKRLVPPTPEEGFDELCAVALVGGDGSGFEVRPWCRRRV